MFDMYMSQFELLKMSWMGYLKAQTFISVLKVEKSQDEGASRFGACESRLTGS